MNKKGQVLVFFIILIPIFLTIAAFAIDLGYNYYQSNVLNNLNKMAIKYGMKHINDSNVRTKMIDLIYKNNRNIDEYTLLIENNKITLVMEESIDSIFGKVINIKTYYLTSKYRAYYKNDVLIIEKG